jgi:hypothetical protein
MSKRLIIIILCCVSVCCTNHQVEKRNLPHLNPVVAVFPFSYDSLRKQIVAIFESGAFAGSKIYNNSLFRYRNELGDTMLISFVTETRETALFATEYFVANPGDSSIFLFNIDGRGWLSLYHKGGQALPFRSSFVIDLQQCSPTETRMRVRPYKPVVIDGLKCCGPHGRYGNEVAVEGTTVEEYTLICFVGEQLGLRFPKVIQP